MSRKPKLKLAEALVTSCLLLSGGRALAVAEGDMMPAVDITARDGKTKLEWKGKVAVINFWATWCEACKVELKEMNKDFAPLHSRDDVMVGYVSLDKEPEKAREYLTTAFGADALVSKNLAHDQSFKAADTLGVDSFPMTLVIDKNGKIVKIQRGFKDGEGSTQAMLKFANELK